LIAFAIQSILRIWFDEPLLGPAPKTDARNFGWRQERGMSEPEFATSSRPPQSTIAAVFVAAVYALSAPFLATVARNGGWAEADANNYHVVVINHFLNSGLDLQFAASAHLTTFPGYDACVAIVAEALGTRVIRATGTMEVACQTAFGAIFIVSLIAALLLNARDKRVVAPLALAGVSSSYILFSWIWVTTDIAALAFLTAIVALSSTPRTGLVVALQVLLFAAAIAMRQNMAALGVVPAAQIVIAMLTGRDRTIRGIDGLAALAFGMTAVTAVAVMFLVWGGVVPPLSGDYLSGGVNAAALVHVLSLTGLVAWPFFLPFTRALEARGSIVVSLALSAVFAVALAWTADLPIGQDSHLRGSIVWTIGAHLKNKILIDLFLTASIFIGAQILAAATIVSIAKGIGLFEILALGAYLGAQVLGRFPFQRYVEPYALVMLSIFAARLPLVRSERATIGLFYGSYLCVSVAKLFV
jgi:hypothetical protein